MPRKTERSRRGKFSRLFAFDPLEDRALLSVGINGSDVAPSSFPSPAASQVLPAGDVYGTGINSGRQAWSVTAPASGGVGPSDPARSDTPPSLAGGPSAGSQGSLSGSTDNAPPGPAFASNEPLHDPSLDSSNLGWPQRGSTSSSKDFNGTYVDHAGANSDIPGPHGPEGMGPGVSYDGSTSPTSQNEISVGSFSSGYANPMSSWMTSGLRIVVLVEGAPVSQPGGLGPDSGPGSGSGDLSAAGGESALGMPSSSYFATAGLPPGHGPSPFGPGKWLSENEGDASGSGMLGPMAFPDAHGSLANTNDGPEPGLTGGGPPPGSMPLGSNGNFDYSLPAPPPWLTSARLRNNPTIIEASIASRAVNPVVPPGSISPPILSAGRDVAALATTALTSPVTANVQDGGELGAHSLADGADSFTAPFPSGASAVALNYRAGIKPANEVLYLRPQGRGTKSIEPSARLANDYPALASSRPGPGEVGGAGNEFPASERGPDLFARFSPFDREALDRAIDDFMGNLEQLEAETAPADAGIPVLPGVVAVLFTASAVETVRRRFKKPWDDDSHADRPGRDSNYPGLPRPGDPRHWRLEKR